MLTERQLVLSHDEEHCRWYSLMMKNRWTSFSLKLLRLHNLTVVLQPTASHQHDTCIIKYGSVWKRKGKEEYLYSTFYILCTSQSTQAWITQFYLQIHHACLSFVCVHQMAPPLTEVGDIQLQLTTQPIDPEAMKGWVGLVGWPIADGLPT